MISVLDEFVNFHMLHKYVTDTLREQYRNGIPDLSGRRFDASSKSEIPRESLKRRGFTNRDRAILSWMTESAV